MNIHPDTKLTFSGHETFPLKYGWLKKAYDIVKNSKEEDARKVFLDEAAIAMFGVGKNMVSSIRHWAQLANIIAINEVSKKLELTEFAHDLLSEQGLDPWLEHSSSLWLIHWHIAKKENLFTYYWVFNHLNRNEFTREQIANYIINELNNNNHELPSSLTLKRDVECFIRNYSQKNISKNNAFSEDDIESPLTELSLIKRLPHDKFSVQRGSKPNLPVEVFVYTLTWFWNSYFSTSSTLSIESATYDQESPGRIFFLDEEAVITYAFETEYLYNIGIHWSETAGLRQFTIISDIKSVFEQAKRNLYQSYRVEL